MLAWLPLAVILAVQAALCVRLIPGSIANADESLYIYSGHQLIHELFHGGGSPYYETWFSGAPVFYPVLAAMADAVGGLAATRLMSLVFMLAATTLLYATTRRIFGYWPAVAAAGLFAGLGLTQSLGVLATFDALALMLTAAAAYCAVRAAEDGPHNARWLLAVPAVLLAANAAKYASAIFDPVVAGLGALLLTRHGPKRVIQRATALSTASVLLSVVMTFLAGTAYLRGVLFTTLARKSGAQAVFGLAKYVSARTIVLSSWHWAGAILALGLVAVLVALFISRERHNAAALASLLLASPLVIVEYVHLHTDVAFSKHADYGAWFACAAAGYALARAAELAVRWRAKIPLAVVAVTVTTFLGVHYSNIGIYAAQTLGISEQDMFLYAQLKPYLELKNGRYLLGGLRDTQMLYADHVNVAWYQYVDDVYIKYPVPGRGGDPHGQAPGPACVTLKPGCMYLEGVAGYRAAIRAHWFDLISMAGNHHSGQDAAIMAAAQSTPGYMLLTTAGGAPTYIYAPAYANTRGG